MTTSACAPPSSRGHWGTSARPRSPSCSSMRITTTTTTTSITTTLLYAPGLTASLTRLTRLTVTDPTDQAAVTGGGRRCRPGRSQNGKGPPPPPPLPQPAPTTTIPPPHHPTTPTPPHPHTPKVSAKFQKECVYSPSLTQTVSPEMRKLSQHQVTLAVKFSRDNCRSQMITTTAINSITPDVTANHSAGHREPVLHPAAAVAVGTARLGAGRPQGRHWHAQVDRRHHGRRQNRGLVAPRSARHERPTLRFAL